MPWSFSDRDELQVYLRPSELCDSGNLFVKENALKITTGAETPAEAAIKIFYFVRDKIQLAMIHPWKTASETLKTGKGNCLTKATL